MKTLVNTLAAGVGGTTFMTIGSELMTRLGSENFREPEHLGTMIGRMAPWLSKRASGIAGWGAHYAMGFVFAAVFVELWQCGKIKPSLKNSLLLGTMAGLAGILIWRATFKLHPLPPRIKYLDFYIQRIPAHIVFTVFATLIYRAMDNTNKNHFIC